MNEYGTMALLWLLFHMIISFLAIYFSKDLYSLWLIVESLAVETHEGPFNSLNYSTTTKLLLQLPLHFFAVNFLENPYPVMLELWVFKIFHSIWWWCGHCIDTKKYWSNNIINSIKLETKFIAVTPGVPWVTSLCQREIFLIVNIIVFRLEMAWS